jgi:hypothetical protein
MLPTAIMLPRMQTTNTKPAMAAIRLKLLLMGTESVVNVIS